MANIPLPTNLTIVVGSNQNTATVTIEPFYPGYGTTIGNALRRVLLSSLPGAAITAFSVKGTQHEFSTLPHVKEDLVEIALNLKRVRLKVFSTEPVRLKLTVSGERVVVAGDITTTSEVEIANRSQVIATLTDPAAVLELELIVRSGRGYEQSEAREHEQLEVGMVALDALFSPTRKVGFQIENVRVGQMTNWDKLVLEIETDGTITPREAMTVANQYLIDHVSGLAGLLTEPEVGPGEPALVPEAASPELEVALVPERLAADAEIPPSPNVAEAAKRRPRQSDAE